jgi:excisionase family DNA binding protein
MGTTPPRTPKPTTDLEQLLTVREVAALEAVSPKTITRRITAGELPALRTGRLLRIRPQDLRTYRLKQMLGG